MPDEKTTSPVFDNPPVIETVVGVPFAPLKDLGNNPTGQEAGTLEEPVSETSESVVPDTDQAHTVQQMAQAWEAISRQVAEDDVPLSIDPDDYPLF